MLLLKKVGMMTNNMTTKSPFPAHQELLTIGHLRKGLVGEVYDEFNALHDMAMRYRAALVLLASDGWELAEYGQELARKALTPKPEGERDGN